MFLPQQGPEAHWDQFIHRGGRIWTDKIHYKKAEEAI